MSADVKGKKEYIREAIEALSPNDYEQVTRQAAQEWLKNKYGEDAVELAESTFFNTRREMMGHMRKRAKKPSVIPLGSATTIDTPLNNTSNGIVALVRQLKQVVTKLGKNETKELIDVL